MIEKIGDRYLAKVDPGDGSPVQNFFGNSPEEVTEKLIEAQKNATRKIREQKRALATRVPDPPAPDIQFNGRKLTPQEASELSSRILIEAPEAVERIIETRLGAPLDQIRTSLKMVHQMNSRATAVEESQKFMSENPSYYPTPANEALILQYLQSHNMGFTAANLAEAYEVLKESFESKPGSPASADVRVTPRSAVVATAPKGSAQAPASKQKPKWTPAEINAMSAAEYKRNLSNPEFVRTVNALFAPPKP